MHFSSRRSPVYSLHGACASSQPLATQAGIRILEQGGNAVDAAIAICACLAVVEPCSTGLGGDAFALFYNASTKQVQGINGSGRSASALTLSHLSSFKHMPHQHGLSVTVPGAAQCWLDMLAAWGSVSPATALGPAIALARNGFAVSPVTAHWWANEAKVKLEAPCPFLPPPAPGSVFRNPDLATTLADLATRGREAIYSGERAEAVCATVRAKGGLLSVADLEAHRSEWVQPVKMRWFHGARETDATGVSLAARFLGGADSRQVRLPNCSALTARPLAKRYRSSVDVYECPANGQGVCALMAMDLLQSFPLPSARNSPEHLHLLFECMKSAYADSLAHVSDPAWMKMSSQALLDSPELKQARLARISPLTASPVGRPLNTSETVSFCVVDAKGNAVSMVNSNYQGFGTGFCPPHCGFTLQNRGANFSLDPNHPNCAAGNKRPFHTILPAMSLFSADSSLHACFNVMGGFMQPQGHLQVLSNLVDWHDDPQRALDQPRFCLDLKGGVKVEPGLVRSDSDKALLESIGHRITSLDGWDRVLFGRGQVIARDFHTGVLCCGSDGRADGCALASSG